MRNEVQKYHLSVLNLHSANMFESLVWSFNLITETPKVFQFEDKEGRETEPLKGHFAIKDVDGRKTKYFIKSDLIDLMPIRVNSYDELLFKDSSKSKSVVLVVTNATPFKIKPDNCYPEFHKFIDDFANFQHSKPDLWTLHKLIGIIGLVGKAFICDCSEAEFGKSSIYEIINELTKKSPVFQPRSVPGVLAQITGDGNIVFDEVHESTSETKQCMENFALQVGGNKPVYINGAMRSTNTKARYDVAQQSITFLYNTCNHYRDPEKEFFDYIFSNNKAIDSRFLKLKFDGVLIEKFDKDFDMIAVAEKNKMEYIRIAKYFMFLKQLRMMNQYARRFFSVPRLDLKGRKKIIFDEITWIIDMYSRNQEEYDKFFHLLEQAVIDYSNMVGKNVYYKKNEVGGQLTLDEELVCDSLDFIRQNGGEVGMDSFMKNYSQGELNRLIKSADVFCPKPDRIRILE